VGVKGGATDGTSPAPDGQASLLDRSGKIKQIPEVSTGKVHPGSILMKWPGISLKTIMLAIAIFAFDFALLSGRIELPELSNDEVHMVVIGLLPMANVLAFSFPRLLWLGLPRFLRCVHRKPFSVGFQATSWVTTLAFLIAIVLRFEAVLELMDSVCPGLINMLANTCFASRCSMGRYYLEGAPPVGLLES
jgi:hypothetical protein